jgi:hypothetical protein
MDSQPTQDEIREFITRYGLDRDLLDEREEALETLRLKWEDLAKGFMNYLEDRFSTIEHRLDRLEKMVRERNGRRKD